MSAPEPRMTLGEIIIALEAMKQEVVNLATERHVMRTALKKAWNFVVKPEVAGERDQVRATIERALGVPKP